jgi:peptidyl-dipeptidase Dcp
MKKPLLLAALALTLGGGLSAQTETTASTDNPLLKPFETPHGIAPFERITIDNYREAMLKGMEEQKLEVSAIIKNRAVPDFENTIEALDRSGSLLERVQGTFGPLSSSNSTDETRALQKELSPLFSAHHDDIYLNPLLFDKVKQVYDRREQLGLNKEQTRLLENTYKRFTRGGANLGVAD